jgi:hypothetical protein
VVRFGGYPFDVAISCGHSRDAITRKMRKLGALSDDEELSEFTSLGRTTRFSNGSILVQLRTMPGTPFWWGVFSHEVFHAVTQMMDKIGCRLTDDSDEAFAYAIQDLTERILSVLPKRR